MCPLGELHILITHLVSLIEAYHFGDVLLPDGNVLVNHRVVALVFQFNQLILSWEEHTDAKTLGRTMRVTEFQPLRPLEGSNDIVGDITVGIGIPNRTIFGIIMAELFEHKELVAIDKHFEGESELAFGIVLVLGSILIFALELYGTHRVAVTNHTGLRRTHGLHTVLCLHLLDNVSRQFGIIVVCGPTRLDVKRLTGVQVTVGSDNQSPAIHNRRFLILGSLVLGIGIIEASTERGDSFAAVYLADAGSIAVRVFQHLIDELHLDDPFIGNQVGILGSIAAELILQFPTLMPDIEVVFLTFRLLRLLDVRPVEHAHVLSVAANQEHRQRRGVVLLDDAVDDGSG